MQAGKLRHTVQLLYPPDNVQGADTLGDVPPQYTPGPMVAAAIEPLSVKELWLAQQVRANVTHKVTLRWRGDLTAKMRFQWNDGNRLRVFEFGPALSTEERHIDLILTAIEKVP